MNKQSEKTISLNLYREYDYYRDINGERAWIADITPAQFGKLMATLEKKEIPKNACIANLTLNASIYHVLHRATYKSDSLMYRAQLEHILGRHTKSPCTCPKNPAGRTKMTPLQKCATNIRNGECKCPFVADVIGRIILPELYAQKTK